MLKELASQSEVYIVTGYSDLRKGIDGLAAAVKGKWRRTRERQSAPTKR